MLNTILYNWDEGLRNIVNKKHRNTSDSTAVTIASSSRLPLGDNGYDVGPNNDALFDSKISLITEGIE